MTLKRIVKMDASIKGFTLSLYSAGVPVRVVRVLKPKEEKREKGEKKAKSMPTSRVVPGEISETVEELSVCQE